MSISLSVRQQQMDLSWPMIVGSSTVLTAGWAYLWYAPPHVMRRRDVQTWWQAGGYLFMWLLGLYGAYREGLLDIFSHMEDVWAWPAITSRSTMLYFEVQIAWYTSSLVCTLIDRSAKDFWVMLFHHIITPVEIFFSYDCGYSAIGLVIMVLHDTSDVFLHVAKTFNHAKLSRFADITFVVFTTVFFITRLILLPMCPYAYFTGTADYHTLCGDALAYTCSILVLLHLYWFHLIVLMLIRFLSAGNVPSDIRDQDGEGDDDDGGQKKRQKSKKAE